MLSTKPLCLLVFTSLIWRSFAFAQLNQISVGWDQVVADEEAESRSTTWGLLLEMRGQEDRRGRPQSSSDLDVQELSLLGQHALSSDWSLSAEASIEKYDDESAFLIKQAFVESSPSDSLLNLRVGQQFMNVGLFNRMDNWFSSFPSYYETLFTSKKGIDLGVELAFLPLRKQVLYFEIGQYAGRMLRPGDLRRVEPEVAPRYISMKSRSESYETFITYFEHDLALFDPVRAWGAGLAWRLPTIFGLRTSFWLEGWRIHQHQVSGPDQWTHALTGYALGEWRKFNFGLRWSEGWSELRNTSGADPLSTEQNRLFHLDYLPQKFLRLRVEDVQETLSTVRRNELAFRLILDLSNSF